MTTKPDELLLRQHSRHAYETLVLRATLPAFLRHLYSLLWVVGVKHFSQKEMFFAKIHITTPAAPLLQAYQGGFFFLVPKQLMLNADSLRWLSNPKPRLVLPPMGEKLSLHPIHCLENRQASSTVMGGCS
jgi:hypothetical protein